MIVEMANHNCTTIFVLLYRSVSLLCCGKDDMHIELRVRTLCELVLNASFYLTEDKVSFISSANYEDNTRRKTGKNILPALSANYENSRQHLEASHESSISVSVFQLDCVDTAKLGTYANMWHIYALSSVLGQPITSVFPDNCPNIRPVLNRMVVPRQPISPPCGFDRQLVVMWTRAGPMDSSKSWWTANHFVPCVDLSKGDSKLWEQKTCNLRVVCEVTSRELFPCPAVSSSGLVLSSLPHLCTPVRHSLKPSLPQSEQKLADSKSPSYAAVVSTPPTLLLQPNSVKSNSRDLQGTRQDRYSSKPVNPSPPLVGTKPTKSHSKSLGSAAVVPSPSTPILQPNSLKRDSPVSKWVVQSAKNRPLVRKPDSVLQAKSLQWKTNILESDSVLNTTPIKPSVPSMAVISPSLERSKMSVQPKHRDILPTVPSRTHAPTVPLSTMIRCCNKIF